MYSLPPASRDAERFLLRCDADDDFKVLFAASMSRAMFASQPSPIAEGFDDISRLFRILSVKTRFRGCLLR